MPKMSLLERNILQSSNTKEMFLEKFEQMIRQREEEENQDGECPPSPKKMSRYALPRDTHEYESKVVYNDIPIPVKIPTVIWPETVGDFSLIKLIQTFAAPHATSPQAFPAHPHLTTSGPFTHPIIVLVNAILTQKRVIFLGHNRPSGEVAEAVLAACALASGGILRGFTRHAFPYTDLTKIDDLLKVPGFIAGVTNPTFANHPEWWDVMCDLPTGRMKISTHVEPAPVTEGLLFFQQQNSLLPNHASNTTSDPTGDTLFMEDILRSITQRHGENAIRAKWRAYITKFVRVAAAFEEAVYGASNLYIIGPGEELSPDSPTGQQTDANDPTSLRGHGYVWADDNAKQRELSASVSTNRRLAQHPLLLLLHPRHRRHVLSRPPNPTTRHPPPSRPTPSPKALPLRSSICLPSPVALRQRLRGNLPAPIRRSREPGRSVLCEHGPVSPRPSCSRSHSGSPRPYRCPPRGPPFLDSSWAIRQIGVYIA